MLTFSGLREVRSFEMRTIFLEAKSSSRFELMSVEYYIAKERVSKAKVVASCAYQRIWSLLQIPTWNCAQLLCKILCRFGLRFGFPPFGFDLSLQNFLKAYRSLVNTNVILNISTGYASWILLIIAVLNCWTDFLLSNLSEYPRFLRGWMSHYPLGTGTNLWPKYFGVLQASKEGCRGIFDQEDFYRLHLFGPPKSWWWSRLQLLRLIESFDFASVAIIAVRQPRQESGKYHTRAPAPNPCPPLKVHAHYIQKMAFSDNRTFFTFLLM